VYKHKDIKINAVCFAENIEILGYDGNHCVNTTVFRWRSK